MRGGLAPAYLAYWGKAQPEDPASSPCHPIAYHALDVAAVMQALLRARAGAVRRASRLLGVGDEDAIALCTALASFRDPSDLGIASRLTVRASMSAYRPDDCQPLPLQFRPDDRWTCGVGALILACGGLGSSESNGPGASQVASQASSGRRASAQADPPDANEPCEAGSGRTADDDGRSGRLCRMVRAPGDGRGRTREATLGMAGRSCAGPRCTRHADGAVSRHGSPHARAGEGASRSPGNPGARAVASPETMRSGMATRRRVSALRARLTGTDPSELHSLEGSGP